ncbi:hypothetical protein TWF970_007337 [Orbilia oligospora]|uniref:Uncharacterized protein n=1 Tax=Orbilia oligospora TaxID=2813651 RepID=A0A7C8VPM9_ORBOL|nr:hypothetical protein TWF970_007337 [Orbilia oligospora]
MCGRKQSRCKCRVKAALWLKREDGPSEQADLQWQLSKGIIIFIIIEMMLARVSRIKMSDNQPKQSLVSGMLEKGDTGESMMQLRVHLYDLAPTTLLAAGIQASTHSWPIESFISFAILLAAYIKSRKAWTVTAWVKNI